MTKISATLSADRAPAARRPTSTRGELVGQGRATEGRGEEAGQRDADLHGRQEAVGVVVQPGDGPSALAAVGQLLDLAVAQRDQGHLGRDEHAAGHDEQEDDEDVEQGLVHEVGPRAIGGSKRPDHGSGHCS